MDYYTDSDGTLRCLVEYEQVCRLDDPDAAPFDYPLFDIPADDLEDLGDKNWDDLWKKLPFRYGEHVRHKRNGYLGEVFDCYEDDEQDIRSLAVEIATLTRRQQRGRGLRMA